MQLINDQNFITDEIYDKSFQISVTIDGVSSKKLIPVLSITTGHNRWVSIR